MLAYSFMKNRLTEYACGLSRQSLHAFERGELMRTFILALIALGAAYLAALGLNPRTPRVGDLWEWIVGLWVIFLFVFVAPFRLWLAEKEKVDAFEDTARPKLSLSDPICVVDPKGSIGGSVKSREWRLRVKNESTALIKNCYIKQKGLINKDGHESDIVGIHFKLNTDQPAIIQSYEHRQSFDLPPGGNEVVCIAGTNTNVPQMIIMLYAVHGVGGQGIRNAIPPALFPHTLTIEVCADNISKPIEKKYFLSVDSDGIFTMETMHRKTA